MKILIKTLLLALLTSSCYAEDIDLEAQKLLSSHYKTYKDLEYFSGATLSFYIPNQRIKNFYVGTVSHDKNSKKITADTLFQIGSITKSFTAAMMLQLEKEGKLTLKDPLGFRLPQYLKWSQLTLTQLLNMTSGLPNYSDTPVMNAMEANNLSRLWSNRELINFVYPKAKFTPPLKTGYFYSNTGYILSDLMIEKITHHSFKSELIKRTIESADLNDTFYPIPLMDTGIQKRMAHGYNYNQYDNPFLVGKDIAKNNLSWAGAAGGLVSTTEDVVKWVKALFVENQILDSTEKQEMMQLISTSTGKSIEKVTLDDPRGFGLGISQGIMNDPLERYWFYEGETLGFRALYMYTPCNGVIIASIFNSATNPDNDHAKELMKAVNKLILNQYPQLVCKPE